MQMQHLTHRNGSPACYSYYGGFAYKISLVNRLLMILLRVSTFRRCILYTLLLCDKLFTVPQCSQEEIQFLFNSIYFLCNLGSSYDHGPTYFSNSMWYCIRLHLDVSFSFIWILPFTLPF